MPSHPRPPAWHDTDLLGRAALGPAAVHPIPRPPQQLGPVIGGDVDVPMDPPFALPVHDPDLPGAAAGRHGPGDQAPLMGEPIGMGQQLHPDGLPPPLEGPVGSGRSPAASGEAPSGDACPFRRPSSRSAASPSVSASAGLRGPVFTSVAPHLARTGALGVVPPAPGSSAIKAHWRATLAWDIRSVARCSWNSHRAAG